MTDTVLKSHAEQIYDFIIENNGTTLDRIYAKFNTLPKDSVRGRLAELKKRKYIFSPEARKFFPKDPERKYLSTRHAVREVIEHA